MTAATAAPTRIVLHDHLDGGLRPQTVLDLCAEQGVDAPGGSAAQVGEWFFRAADSGSLERYLSTFGLTVGLMQNAEALRRVACEFVLDMAADSVVYAETRWAPQLHLRDGLDVEQAVEAVAEGLGEGMALAADRGTPVVARQILCLMRHLPVDEAVVDAVVSGAPLVVGMDVAGPEEGHPLARLADPLRRVREAGRHLTLHAGEGAGVASVAEALDLGAERLGHGVRVVEDLTGPADDPGPTATRVLDRSVPLEVCPTSNLQTGVAATMADHPLPRLWRRGFALTVNPDNRLMSRTTPSRELGLAARACHWDDADLARVTRTALDAAFCSEADRQQVARLIDAG